MTIQAINVRNQFKGKVKAEGKDLAGLIRMAGQQGPLPGFLGQPFGAEGDMVATAAGAEVKGLAVSLGETEAKGTVTVKTENGVATAARLAARMLPQVFRLDSPVFEVKLPPEHQQELEHLVSELAVETFTASDSLGWVYQYRQSKRKDEVNASEVKIGARELPAVTQLFTEPYMVSFLLDNSLGAWWSARRLTEDELQNAGSEE